MECEVSSNQSYKGSNFERKLKQARETHYKALVVCLYNFTQFVLRHMCLRYDSFGEWHIKDNLFCISTGYYDIRRWKRLVFKLVFFTTVFVVNYTYIIVPVYFPSSFRYIKQGISSLRELSWRSFSMSEEIAMLAMMFSGIFMKEVLVASEFTVGLYVLSCSHVREYSGGDYIQRCT